MAERKPEDTADLAVERPGVANDSELDLLIDDQIADGETASEDSGAGSFLDRFLSPAPGRR